MSDRILLGDVLDARIQKCGVSISGDQVVQLRPFLQASSDISGRFRLLVNKRSSSGTSVTSQAGNFVNGTLGNVTLALNAPAEVDISLTLEDKTGGKLCSLAQTVSWTTV